MALGRFDGVHRAHKAVITAATEFHKTLTPAVFTFCDNPGKSTAKLLCTQSEKEALIENCGTQLLVNATFDSVRNLSAEEFVTEVLIKRLNAKAILCGYNYRFGKGACGNVDTLKELCRNHSLQLVCIEELQGVSSTSVRNLLSDGKVRKAAELLGRNYCLSGEIIHGKALGRTIETPTLNINVPKEKLLPRYGVYATLATIDGTTYKSVTNIGMKPTVGTDTPTTETYLLDAQGNFYAKHAEIELVEFLREEQKFSSLEELRSVINLDIEKAKSTLNY